ncbi:TlpA disulfide reductase family protein [Pedobacter sp. UBA4863]|uniref:TlpA family protein disulfide reductase n=1 Tax=Pedobacter sp. UBA4863 TaxID=1947060 RepID=UPI0025CC2745|nr:TlpA disulfide reductase family protein [Pedobacter sp. UBA4863]
MKKTTFITLIMVFRLTYTFAQDSLWIQGTIDERFNNKEIKLYKYIGHKNSMATALELVDTIINGSFGFKFAAKTAESYKLICQDYKKNADGYYSTKITGLLADTGVVKIQIDSMFNKVLAEGKLQWNKERDSLAYYLRGDLFDPTQINKAEVTFIKKHLQNPFSGQLLFELYNKIEDKILDSLTKILPSKQFESSTGMFIKFLTDSVIVGKSLAYFQLPDTLGTMINSKTLLGKYVLFDFWASWCVPCRAENPYIKQIYKKYKNKLQIVQISFDKDKDKWLEAIGKDGLQPFIHISDLKNWDSLLSKKFNIMSIPANLIVDPNGKIIARNLRGKKMLEEVRKLINK